MDLKSRRVPGGGCTFTHSHSKGGCCQRSRHGLSFPSSNGTQMFGKLDKLANHRVDGSPNSLVTDLHVRANRMSGSLSGALTQFGYFARPVFRDFHQYRGVDRAKLGPRNKTSGIAGRGGSRDIGGDYRPRFYPTGRRWARERNSCGGARPMSVVRDHGMSFIKVERTCLTHPSRFLKNICARFILHPSLGFSSSVESRRGHSPHTLLAQPSHTDKWP